MWFLTSRSAPKISLPLSLITVNLSHLQSPSWSSSVCPFLLTSYALFITFPTPPTRLPLGSPAGLERLSCTQTMPPLSSVLFANC